MVSVLNFVPLAVGTMKLTIPKLRDKVWKCFSKYIILRDREKPCVTCKSWSENWQSGHFIHGKNSLTYFDETNVNKQCPRCNLYLSGNEVAYTLYMIETYGKEHIERLQEEHARKHIWTREELEEKLELYKLKVKELE